MQKRATSMVRLYLVEDQALIRESLRALLESEPTFEVTGEAAEAEQALRELGTANVDVVLMDIGLPGLDGIEATRLLKKIQPDLPVVMLTSYQDEYVGEAIEAGASGYILKSSTRQHLIQAVQDACQGQMPIDPSVTASLAQELADLRKTHRNSLLTPRQMEILKLVANGTPYRGIAAKLFVSVTTVNREMRNIFNRLGVNDAAHAVSQAYEKHLI